MRGRILVAAALFAFGAFFLDASGVSESPSQPGNGADATLVNMKTEDTPINPDEKIRKIEKGFSSVLYEGNYGFDDFLRQGGADSDKAVLAFLTDNFLVDAGTLSFDGQAFGCSTLSVSEAGGGYLFGRNFDWMNCDILVISSRPYNGYSSVSTVNLDFVRQTSGALFSLLPDKMLALASHYAPLDGMNEKGLCVAVNMIEDYSSTINQDTQKPDITTTTAVRLLLDKASDVDEAVSLLKSYDMHASFGYMVHFALADAEGNSVAVEYVDNEMKVVPTQILTNFYLAEGKKQGIGSSQSHVRYEILDELLKQSNVMSKDDVPNALRRVSKNNFEEFLSTEWSIVYDQTNLKAQYFHREDYTRSYSFVLQ